MPIQPTPPVEINISGARGENIYDTVRRLGLGGASASSTDAEAAAAYATYIAGLEDASIVTDAVAARDAAAAYASGLFAWNQPFNRGLMTAAAVSGATFSLGDRGIVTDGTNANQGFEKFADGLHYSGYPKDGQKAVIGTDLQLREFSDGLSSWIYDFRRIAAKSNFASFSDGLTAVGIGGAIYMDEDENLGTSPVTDPGVEILGNHFAYFSPTGNGSLGNTIGRRPQNAASRHWAQLEWGQEYLMPFLKLVQSGASPIKVALCGDSNTSGQVGARLAVLLARIPGLVITNYGYGGQTADNWVNATGGFASGQPAENSSLAHVKADNPDLVVLCFGTNEPSNINNYHHYSADAVTNHNAAIADALAQLRANESDNPSKPAIVLCTPSMMGEGTTNTATTEKRDELFAARLRAGTIANAKQYGCAFFDKNRYSDANVDFPAASGGYQNFMLDDARLHTQYALTELLAQEICEFILAPWRTGTFFKPTFMGGATADASIQGTNYFLDAVTVGSFGYGATYSAIDIWGSAGDRIDFKTTATLRWQIATAGHLLPGADNTYNIGSGSKRAATIYAGTGTINTSDERDKKWRGGLLPAELAASKAILSEIGGFQFLGAIDQKAGNARIHIGVKAQKVWAIMERHGLNPASYAFLCFDKWEAADGQAAGDRYGIRPDELSYFLIAGLNDRLIAIESK